MKLDFLKRIGDSSNKTNRTENTTQEIGDALNTPKKTPEEIITENLQGLIGINPTRTLPEEQRKKHRNNHKLVTKVIGDQEVDYISPEIYLKLVDKKILEQNYKFFEEILRASGGIKDGKHINEVNDGGIVYKKLEEFNIPKGYMTTVVGTDNMRQEDGFVIPIYNPKMKHFEDFRVNSEGYQTGVFLTDTYHICLGLPSYKKPR